MEQIEAKDQDPGDSQKDVRGPIVAEKRKSRKRSRHIYLRIREQMEFYFSDANLNKDRFMKQLIKDSFVPLEIFLTFNKIKNLTESKTLEDSIEMIAKALSNSELLELDETRKMVRRKTAVVEQPDVDERTIYVEALPNNVDHDWMKSMFSRFGKVIYVSLPKHAQSRKPKDFGFVEFQKQKSVPKAIAYFKAFNGVLLKEETDPANLASIKAHSSNVKAEPEEPEKLEKTTTKRPLTDKQDEFVAKKAKLEEDLVPTTDGNSTSSEEKTENEVKEEQTNETKVKRRKHKKSYEKRKKQLELATDAAFYELKILPKMDWKRLRNKYLNLQREKAAEFKRKAAKERQLQQSKENATATGSNREAKTSGTVAKKSKNEERKLHKMKMNFYGAGDNEPLVKNAPAKNPKATAETKPFMKFEQGLIVEIKFDQPCVEIKNFKQQMRQHKAVKYVDIKEGAMEAFLRLETAEDASNFVQSNRSGEGKCNVLCGEAEIAYWDKIERDRQMKLNKEVKIPSKRGREKLKAALAKHILFGDDEGE